MVRIAAMVVGWARAVGDSLERVPFHPVLVAAYPVLLLYSENLADVAPVDAAGPLAIVLIIATAGFGMVALITRRPAFAAVIASAVITMALMFTRVR